MTAGKKKSEEKKSNEKKSDATDKEHLLRDNAEKQLANFPVVSPKLKGQTAEKLIHELQVHQIELETQAEELQRTHLELQESRDKYIDLYDFAPIVYLTLNDKAVITEANLTGALLLGVVRRKLIKTQFRKFIVPKYLDHWDRLFFNMIRTGESQSFDIELMQSDGTTFPARLDCIRIKKSGELSTIRIAISDITRQKEAESAIRESEERFWQLFSKIPLPYQSLDAEGRLLEVSPRWSETLGYSRNEVVGRSFDDFLAPENRELFRTVFEKYKVSGAVSNIEFLMRKKDGSNLRVIYTGRIGHNPDGSFQQTYCILEDVTIRRQNEEALKEINTRHSLLLKQAHDMIFIHEITENGPGKFLEVNDKICTLLGYTREELLEMDVSDINVPEQNKKIPGLLKNLFSNHNVTFETQFFTKDARRVSVEISAAFFDLRGKQTVLAIGRDITDRKQADAALRETSAELKFALRSAKAGTWEWDFPTGKLVWSPEFFELFNLPTNTPPSFETWLAALHPDDRTPAMEKIDRSVKVHQDLWNEYRILLPDKGWRWIGAAGSSTYNNAGEPLHMSGVCIDITERKRAEEAVQAAVNLNQLIDSLSVEESMGYTLDEAERCTNSKIGFFHLVNPNENTIQLVTWSTETKKYCYISKEPDRNYPVSKAGVWVDCLSERRPVIHNDYASLPHKKGMPEGHVPVIRELVVPLFSGDKIVAIIGVGNKATDYDERDINVLTLLAKNTWTLIQRKKAEESLRETKDYLENLLSYANAPIIVWNPDFEITRFNHAFEELTGRTEIEVLGKCLEILFPQESCNASMDLIKKAHSGEQWKVVEIPILHTITGEVRIVLWNSANILTPDGTKVLATIAQGQDITERKELEKEMEYHALELRKFSTSLASANKKLTLLSSITRHDINNQMTALRGYTTLLQRKQPDPSFAEYFTKINAAAERISAMIQFTREYDSIGINAPVWLDCRIIVDNAAKDAPLGKIIVKNDLPAGAEVFADPLIVKVFYNLMDNAVRYGKKITTIRFSVQETGEDHLIVYDDDGVGILSEEKEKIFERGFGKNTGLGLFLSREILGISAITIKETGEPGKGARFEMTVPKGMWRTAGTGG